MSVDFSQGYAPAQAERGRFVVIDPTTLTNLPSASQGRYAVLTYNIGTSTGSPGTSATTPIYTVAVNPNTLYVASSTYWNQAYSFTPPAALQSIEIYNNSNNTTVFFLASSVTHATLSSYGMPIGSYSYYSLANTSIANFTICASPSADVRIMGFYKS